MRLIQIVIVIVIIVSVIGAMVNAYSNFVDRQRMNEAVEGAVSIIQKARTLTLSGKNDSFYSIHINTSAASSPNQLVLFKANDYVIAEKTIETFSIQSPVIIDSNLTTIWPVPNNKEFMFQRLSGAVLVDTNISSGGANVSTTTLDDSQSNQIVFKSQKTGNTRIIKIYKSGAIEVQ